MIIFLVLEDVSPTLVVLPVRGGAHHLGLRSLVSYSDGCSGQNRNKTIVALYAELHRTGVYEVLNHKYLVRGHTFLQNDTDFNRIEKRKKSAVVYLPEDWCKVVREANTVKPFVVREMRQPDFKDWRSFLESRYQPIAKDRDGKRVRILDAHWLNFGWGEEKDPITGQTQMVHHPDEVWVRYGFSTDEPWKKVNIRRRRHQTDANQTPGRLYPARLKVVPAKLEDLQQIAAFVPEPQRQFYLTMEAAEPEPKDK